MMPSMTTGTNNERLRELVRSAGLPPAVALTIFNRGLGAAACSESVWRSFLAPPDSPGFAPLHDDLLRHAEAQFAKVVPARET